MSKPSGSIVIFGAYIYPNSTQAAHLLSKAIPIPPESFSVVLVPSLASPFQSRSS